MASPSVAPPPKSGGGSAPVIIGVVVLIGAAIGLLCWKNRGDDVKTTPTATTSAPTTTSAPPETTLDLPPIELPKDAGENETGPKPQNTGGGNNGGNCPAVCTGQITDAIKAAAASRAATAKKCYQTALEGNEGLQGEIDIMLRVGTDGSTCSASIASDSTGSGKLAQCVRSRMLGGYPAPKGGCVELKVPVVFKPKQ
jgi:hypothetical protein